MRQPIFNFLLGVVVLTLACFAAQYVWNTNAPAHLHLYHGWALLLVFPVTVTGLHLLLTRSGLSPQASIRTFLGTSMLKLMLYLGVLLIFLLFSKQDKKMLAVHFLAYYAVFSVFEYVMLQIAFRKK